MNTDHQSADAFERHAQDVACLKHLVQVAELDATRELVVDQLVQHYGSHRAGLVEIFTLRYRVLKILDSWSGTLCLDATQKGKPLRDVSSLLVDCLNQVEGAAPADPGPTP